MTEKIIYIAMDGKEFTEKWECVFYEEKLLEKKLKEQQERIKNFYLEMSKKYFENPNLETIKKLDDFQILQWMQSDIRYLGLTHSLKEIKDYIFNSLPLSEDKIYMEDHLDWQNIELDISIRKDFETALKNCKRGRDLSTVLDFSFSEKDISELAKLHKQNKFRSKIESLLTDCNFHSECGDFIEHNYSKYILNV